MLERVLTIGGRNVVLTIEEAFWREFVCLAKARNISIDLLAAAIDQTRDSQITLASAIRHHVVSSLTNGGANEPLGKAEELPSDD